MKSLFTIFTLIFALNLSAQTYGTSSTGWGLNGNRILERNYLGTINNFPLVFKTNKNTAGYFDTDQSLYLLNVPAAEGSDTILMLENGQVRGIKTSDIIPYDPIPARNGLNLDHSQYELGGELIRSTTINTKANLFGIYNSTAMNLPSDQANTLGVNFDMPSNQTTSYRNFNIQTNLAYKIIDQSATNNFKIHNQFTHLGLPALNWGESPITNLSVGIDRAVLNKSNDSTSTRSVNNVINGFIGTSFDAWTQHTAPNINRYIGLMLGYRLPYTNNLDANIKFQKRVELLINPAPDTTSIANNIDIYISNGQVSSNNSNLPISGLYSIYQDNNKPNVFKGSVKALNGLIVPLTDTESQTGSLYLDELENTLKVVLASGTKNVLTYDPAPAIPNPTGGSVVDVEARASIIAILDVLRSLTIIEP